ncbi:putative baseplate assembly protein [Phytohabitans sp. LJ34]|uniref:putative baseplate assembly protein n=1 Tax=Phytohabitans sp. LJ34 TaxID=3452217 RepID=UPI003F8B1B58
MTVPVPDLDDRRWQDLVDEARALIPKYAPQWTDHNPSDLGITLVELFAWLVEGLIFRLNKVPDKNYAAFLNLLGITRSPRTPARTLLTFTAQGDLPVPVPAGTQAQTPAGEGETPVGFETDDAVRVLPAPAVALNLSLPAAGQGSYTNVSDAFVPPPPGGPAGSPPPAGATLSVAPNSTVLLCLGFDRPVSGDVDLYVELAGPLPPGPQPAVGWRCSVATIAPAQWPAVTVRADRTGGLRRDGRIRLTAPAGWAAQAPTSWAAGAAPVRPAAGTTPVTGSYRWLGVSVTNSSANPIQVGLRYLLANTAPATAALSARPSAPEEVGRGDGTPFQVLPLRNRPLFRRPATDSPYDHVTVRVDDQPWTLVDDLPAGPGNHYRLDPVTGEISFGNHEPTTGKGRGTVPPSGSRITASYRYVAAGAAGNVPAGAIAALTAPVPGIVAVRNLAPAQGGADEEPVEETKRRAPQVLRHGNGAVNVEDYEQLAREARPDLAVVRCLPPRVQEQDNGTAWLKGDPWRFASLLRAPGNVNLIVVPDLGPKVDQPEPSTALVQDLLASLDKRRDLATYLHVTGPRYLPIQVSVDVRVFRRAIDDGRVTGPEEVANTIRQRIQAFLHPVHGGPGERGWQVGQSVYLAEVYQAIRPADDIGYVAKLSLRPAVPPYHLPPYGPGGAWTANERPLPLLLETDAAVVLLADYELVCFGQATVTAQPE